MSLGRSGLPDGPDDRSSELSATYKDAPDRRRGLVVRRLELEELYTDYVHCLDADELERWPDFFTEDCFYRITSAENYEAGMPLGLIHATSRNMLKDRVSALREANIYEPQRYRHLVSVDQGLEGSRGDARSRGEFPRRADDAGGRHDPLRRRALPSTRSDATTAPGNSPARMSSSTAVRSTPCWRSRSER